MHWNRFVFLSAILILTFSLTIVVSVQALSIRLAAEDPQCVNVIVEFAESDIAKVGVTKQGFRHLFCIGGGSPHLPIFPEFRITDVETWPILTEIKLEYCNYTLFSE
jgi:hypothetical protein